MLPNLQQFLSLLVCGIQLWGAALTYWLPLRHSPHFWQRALLCLIPSIPLSTFLLWADYTPSSLFLRAGAYILFCMWMIFASHSCTQLDWSGANYCAIWGILSALTTFELWQLLVWCLAQVNIFLPLDQPSALLLQLLFFAAAYCLLRVTVAHSMPYEGSYHIGPRQQISAIILGGMFVLLFLTMQTVTNTGVSRETSIFVVVPLALCQLYCITLLYLQTELFKKAAMEKEMNSLNMLYERQRQQYPGTFHHFPHPINLRQPTTSRLRVPKNSETKNSALAVSTIAGPAGRLIAQERLNPSQAQSAPIPAASSRMPGSVRAQQRAATAGSIITPTAISVPST